MEAAPGAPRRRKDVSAACVFDMMQEKRRQIANDVNALLAPCKQANARIGDVLGNFDLQVKHHFALQQSSLPLTIVY
jgi:hypothetical protein